MSSIVGSAPRASVTHGLLVRLCLAAAAAASMAMGGAAAVQAQAPAGLEGRPSSLVPFSAFFVGLGASYTSANFVSQQVYAQGVSAIFLNDVLVGAGSAGGSTDPYLDPQSTLAPGLQLGYFRHFTNSKWLWGAKLTYSYVDATSTTENLAVPQVGAFTSSTPDTFTGNVVIRAYRTTVGHQMAFMSFFGRSFEKGFVYLGAGPTLSQTKYELDNVIGFADINGTHFNITGTPSNFSSSPWVYGGAVMVGGTYFLDPNLFLDFSYTYGQTKAQRNTFAGPFSTTTDGYVDVGILSGHYSGRVITQSLSVSINTTF